MPAGRSTFIEPQKEQTRLQKRQEKTERKKQRALEKKTLGPKIDWASAVNRPRSADTEDTPEAAL